MLWNEQEQMLHDYLASPTDAASLRVLQFYNAAEDIELFQRKSTDARNRYGTNVPLKVSSCDQVFWPAINLSPIMLRDVSGNQNRAADILQLHAADVNVPAILVTSPIARLIQSWSWTHERSMRAAVVNMPRLFLTTVLQVPEVY